MGKVPFLKMHGLGNDFVVLDARHDGIELGAEDVRKLADRHTGIGCDQLIVLEPPCDPQAQLLMQIRNPDGSTAEACGNATRCIALLLHGETGGRTRADRNGGRIARSSDFAGSAGCGRYGGAAHRLARDSARPRRGHPSRRYRGGTAGRAGLHQYRQPARDVFCRRRRRDRSRQIWSGARASSVVSTTCQYRSGDRSRPGVISGCGCGNAAPV